MTIPVNPAVPSLPLAPQAFARQYQDQFANVLRLYFNQLSNTNSQTIQQVSSNQTLIWLNM